jgi:hypothetical protein
MTTPTFDRRVPMALAEALAPEGPMHPLVELVHSDLGWKRGLDIRLRARVGHAAARATLYLGLTQVLHVHLVSAGRFRLEGQSGKGFCERLDPTLFQAAWSVPQSLEWLAAEWAAVMGYVRAAIDAAPARYVNAEGLMQARLARRGAGIATIDREVVISFPSQEAKNAALAPDAAAIETARRTLAGTEPWAAADKRFGDELDLLGVDGEGRVLVIEAKHGSDTGGVGWTPAQVARYLRIVELWADATPWAGEVLNGMLAQARRIGISGGGDAVVAEPLVLVPVIAVGQPLKNAAIANTRMRRVVDTLAQHGVELAGLEVWAVDEAGSFEHVGLGRL